MTKSFRERIRQSIADEALQAALDANAERRVAGRLAAFASLPDWQERRQRAHTVRAEVIAHLDQYLDTFTAKASENGIIVHRAQDSKEAVETILAIAGDTGARKLIAKSKSMVSEEIELNHALEAAGHRVVETDLGEYIVQLRGEKPSHIITPAVHLRRHEVGQLFHEKLGIPYTEDIPTLTDTARRLLREVFLTADIGLSGVNFGVAETGGLCIVTNEGNGRMVTTLPPVHIALMGMERLVPSLDDLALMLSLLPRSATGQKMSVYTQLIQQPLPGQQRHLVLLDNGRSRMRNSPLMEALYCIRCGSCLNACPVFRELSGHAYLGRGGSIAPYPGPIGSVVSPGLLGTDYAQLAQASSLCGACKEACPVDIDLPKLLLRVRAGAAGHEKREKQEGVGIPSIVKWGLRLFGLGASHPRLFGATQRVVGLAGQKPRFLPLPAWSGWGLSKDMPLPDARPFRTRVKRQGKYPEEKTIPVRVIPEPEAPVRTAPAREDPVDRFTRELTALNVHLYRMDKQALPEKIIELLKTRGIKHVQAWDDVPGLEWRELSAGGIQVQGRMDASLKAGIAGVLAGVAETGTLVIPGGEGQPLTASLVPGILIAVLRTPDIHPSLEEVFRLYEVASLPSVALVTGPSRTADIEMALTIGVHGPGEVHVFLIDDSAAV